MADENKGAGVTITVALIGLIGVLGAAYIATALKSPKPQHIIPSAPSQPTDPRGPTDPSGTPPVAQKPQAYMSLLVGNTSYSGSDYTQLSAASAAQCSDDCLAQPRCRSMTYAISTQICWLKDSVPPPQHGSDFVAASKIGG